MIIGLFQLEEASDLAPFGIGRVHAAIRTQQTLNAFAVLCVSGLIIPVHGASGAQ